MNAELRQALWNIILQRLDLEASINWMADNGSSLILNWGDDNEIWEVAWIFDGRRYCGFSKSPREAVITAVGRCMDFLQGGVAK